MKSSRVKPEAQPKLNFDKDVAHFTERQLEACYALDSGKYKYLLYGGALGGGKSYFLRWIAVRLLVDWASVKGLRNVPVMLACEDYPTLKDRQLTKIAMEFPEWLGKSYTDHKEYGRCFILNDNYGSGVICFRNLDDPSKYQSSEFAAILVDELTKNDYDTFTNLRMRLRWPGLENIECPFIGGTNPGGIGHNYCKSFWMDGIFPKEFEKFKNQFVYIPSKADDNPYLPASYYSETLNTLPEHQRAAFRDGSWDMFAGQEFQEWRRAYHVIESLPVPEGRPLLMTFDWGFGAPFSVQWWWVDSEGRLYLFSEWYGWNGTPNKGLRLVDSEIAAGIIKREHTMGFNQVGEKFGKEIVNPQIFRVCDPTCFNKKPDYKGGGQGPSTAEEFMHMGLILVPGDANRKLKLRQFHQRLMIPKDEEDNVTGVPMVQIYSNCQHFIRTIPNLTTNPNNFEDIESDSEDHCLHGDTKVYTPDGLIKIRELAGTKGKVLTPSGWISYNKCWLTRKNTDLIELVLNNGRSIKCTPDHKFLLDNNIWIRAKNLTDEHNLHGKNVKAAGIKDIGKDDVYCFSLPYPHAFIIEGGIISHNCYDSAALAFMARPLSGENLISYELEITRKQPTIEDVAKIDREEAWKEALGEVFYEW